MNKVNTYFIDVIFQKEVCERFHKYKSKNKIKWMALRQNKVCMRFNWINIYADIINKVFFTLRTCSVADKSQTNRIICILKISYFFKSAFSIPSVGKDFFNICKRDRINWASITKTFAEY